MSPHQGTQFAGMEIEAVTLPPAGFYFDWHALLWYSNSNLSTKFCTSTNRILFLHHIGNNFLAGHNPIINLFQPGPKPCPKKFCWQPLGYNQR